MRTPNKIIQKRRYDRLYGADKGTYLERIGYNHSHILREWSAAKLIRIINKILCGEEEYASIPDLKSNITDSTTRI